MQKKDDVTRKMRSKDSIAPKSSIVLEMVSQTLQEKWMGKEKFAS